MEDTLGVWYNGARIYKVFESAGAKQGQINELNITCCPDSQHLYILLFCFENIIPLPYYFPPEKEIK